VSFSPVRSDGQISRIRVSNLIRDGDLVRWPGPLDVEHGAMLQLAQAQQGRTPPIPVFAGQNMAPQASNLEIRVIQWHA